MSSSFCDPTREVCPFGAPIDTRQVLINNVFQALPPKINVGVVGPMPPTISEVPVSIRQAPFIFTGGGGFTFPSLPPISIPISFGGPSPIPTAPIVQGRTPPLLPGRIPPGPSVQFPQLGGGCNGEPPGGPVVNGCCPKGQHPDKKFGVKCVRNRRMNVANMRAAKRATRRLSGFDKMARAAKKELKKLCR